LVLLAASPLFCITIFSIWIILFRIPTSSSISYIYIKEKVRKEKEEILATHLFELPEIFSSSDVDQLCSIICYFQCHRVDTRFQ
jgi:hypothetical protein